MTARFRPPYFRTTARAAARSAERPDPLKPGEAWPRRTTPAGFFCCIVSGVPYRKDGKLSMRTGRSVAAALPIGLAERPVQLLPQLLDIAGHDDQVLSAPLDVLDEIGHQRFLVEAETPEDLLVSDLGPHHPGHDRLDLVLHGD